MKSKRSQLTPRRSADIAGFAADVPSSAYALQMNMDQNGGGVSHEQITVFGGSMLILRAIHGSDTHTALEALPGALKQASCCSP